MRAAGAIATFAAVVGLCLPLPAQAEPTAACLWAGLSAPNREAMVGAVSAGTDPSAALVGAIGQDARRCGFDPHLQLEAAGFIVALSAHRVRLERALAASAHVSAAALDGAWAHLDPTRHAALVGAARGHLHGGSAPAPDPASIAALSAALRLNAPHDRDVLTQYVQVRAGIEAQEAELRAAH
jgi:hypothetical protein